MPSNLSSVAIPPPGGEEGSDLEHPREFPLGFEPLRSVQQTEMRLQSSPVVKDPFCSPLLAPDSMLKGLPPVHIVVRRNYKNPLNLKGGTVTNSNLRLQITLKKPAAI